MMLLFKMFLQPPGFARLVLLEEQAARWLLRMRAQLDRPTPLQVRVAGETTLLLSSYSPSSVCCIV